MNQTVIKPMSQKMIEKSSDDDLEAGNNLIRRDEDEYIPRVPRSRVCRVGCGLFQTGGDIGNCYLLKGNMKQHYFPQIILIGPDYVFSITATLLILGSNGFFIVHHLIMEYHYTLPLVFVGFLGSLISQIIVTFSNPGFCQLKLNQTEAEKYYNETCHPCLKCQTFIPRGAYHCDDCGLCVEELDHHCVWVGKCVGKYNLKLFYIFIFAIFINLAIGILSEVFSPMIH